MPGENTHAAAEAAQRLHAAHAALRADGDVQFVLAPAPPPPVTPDWIKAIGHMIERLLAPLGRALRWIGSWLPDAPVARALLWTVIALALAALAWASVERLRQGRWRLPWRQRSAAAAPAVEEDWTPEAAPARAWLAEADALAAAGRYAEAAHCLLLRSVEDLARRRPQLVRPALTTREIASARALPPAARDLFAGIAALVERSLFGGRPVGAEDWGTARAAYADYALPQAWRA